MAQDNVEIVRRSFAVSWHEAVDAVGLSA